MWYPQKGTQFDAIQARWCYELFFGGAAGGGKSDFLLGDFLQDVFNFKSAWRGIIFRRTADDLQELWLRANEIFPDTGARWREKQRIWQWDNGAFLLFRHYDTIDDFKKYQGGQYTWVGFDELTQWSDPTMYHMMKSRMRSAKGVPVKRIRAAGNPGGVGHSWVKKYFIDPAPGGYKPITDPKSGRMRMFIPSKLTDNIILMQNDPNYYDDLELVGNETLIRMWKHGEWDVPLGTFFDSFNKDIHVISKFEIPNSWYKICGMDYGSYYPFCVLWAAVADGVMYPHIPEGSLVFYREWYGGVDGVGLKMPLPLIVDGIFNREPAGEVIHDRVIDPDCKKSKSGESIIDQIGKHSNWKLHFRPGEPNRKAGWQEMQARLKGRGKPLMYIFPDCYDLIRTMPELIHNPKDPEDVLDNTDDHAGDTARFICQSKPIIQRMTETKIHRRNPTFNDLLNRAIARKKEYAA